MNYKELANEVGLTYQVHSKSIFYGKICDFMVTLSRGYSTINVAIAFTGSEEQVSAFFGRLNMYRSDPKAGSLKSYIKKAIPWYRFMIPSARRTKCIAF